MWRQRPGRAMDSMIRAHSSRMAPFSLELAPQVLEESDGRESEIVDLMKEVAALDPYRPPDRTEADRSCSPRCCLAFAFATRAWL